jgi:hypothetical protein
MAKSDLERLLTPRFLAWALPLVDSKEAIVRVDQFANGTWRLWIWVSHEYLFRQRVQELEKAAREEERSARSDKIPNATMTVYLTGRERRAARRRAQRLSLKRARSGESRMVRLVASYALPGLLKELEAAEAVRSHASQSTGPAAANNSGPEKKPPRPNAA